MADLPMLCFVRHGETEWNRLGRMQGSRDIPLNDLGRTQAVAAGRALSTVHPDARLFDFVSSPLARARATMELIRGVLDLDPRDYVVDERLRERSWGAWEGRTMPEIKQAAASDLGAYKADRWDVAPPGGESYADVCERVAAWLDGLRRPVVAVSHAGVARAVLALVAGLPKADLPTAEIRQGHVLVFEAGAHRWV